MHQMNSLIDSFILPLREIETFHHAGYIRLQKNDKYRQKEKSLHKKFCTKTMSQRIRH